MVSRWSFLSWSMQNYNIWSPLSSSPQKTPYSQGTKNDNRRIHLLLGLLSIHVMKHTAERKQKIDIDEKRQKKRVSHYHWRRILERVLMINERCNVKGYVYEIVTETNKSVTGATDNLRAWWTARTSHFWQSCSNSNWLALQRKFSFFKCGTRLWGQINNRVAHGARSQTQHSSQFCPY